VADDDNDHAVERRMPMVLVEHYLQDLIRRVDVLEKTVAGFPKMIEEKLAAQAATARSSNAAVFETAVRIATLAAAALAAAAAWRPH
jgi:hypothetical protein